MISPLKIGVSENGFFGVKTLKCCTFVVPNNSKIMATVKIVLRQKESKDGTYPLAIRVTKDRKSSFIHLGKSIKEQDWDAEKQRVKKSYINSTRLNNFLIKKLSEANDKLLELETQKSDISAKVVRKNIKPSVGSTFNVQAAIYLEDLEKSGKYNRKSADEPRIKRFKEFLKGEDITFPDISISLLNRFTAYLKGTRNIKERTVINHLVVIRSVFSQAIKAGVADSKYYPFGRGKIQIKFPDSVKMGLTPDEVKKLEDLELEKGSYANHARNIWLFSFYFAGMRISDVLRLKWSDFQDERLHYAMGKNAKAGSLKAPEKALKILMEYRPQENEKRDLVFPELTVLENLDNKYQVQMKISTAVGRLNKALQEIAKEAKIEKKLTLHIARHTFGNISGDKIPVQMLQKLYRHSSITTTIGYQANFIHKDADDALDAVITF
jgi:integrase/recombinase XerD